MSKVSDREHITKEEYLKVVEENKKLKAFIKELKNFIEKAD